MGECGMQVPRSNRSKPATVTSKSQLNEAILPAGSGTPKPTAIDMENPSQAHPPICRQTTESRTRYRHAEARGRSPIWPGRRPMETQPCDAGWFNAFHSMSAAFL